MPRRCPCPPRYRYVRGLGATPVLPSGRELAAIFAVTLMRTGQKNPSIETAREFAARWGFKDDYAFMNDPTVRAALRAQRDGKFGHTPAGFVRLRHVTKDARLIPTIIEQGLVADPRTDSESPNHVFFFVEDPNPGARYWGSTSSSWVTMDVPLQWSGWRSSIGTRMPYRRQAGEVETLTEAPPPGGTVGIWGAVPPEFLSSVNGVPVRDFLHALRNT